MHRGNTPPKPRRVVQILGVWADFFGWWVGSLAIGLWIAVILILDALVLFLVLTWTVLVRKTSLLAVKVVISNAAQ